MRVLRTAGWVLIAAGAVILLYLVYLLFWTNRTTHVAQNELLEEWNLHYGGLPGESAPVTTDPPRGPVTPVAAGDAYAAMWFERPGSDQPPVTDAVLFVVEGTDLEILKRGPGHYVETAGPGEQGNFAVSGHRTTYGAPFYHQDELQAGDEIHVVDRSGRQWTYIVQRSEVVDPTDLWVIGDDPLGNGRPVMTLTTCHPRFSAARRLITFAELAPGSGAEVAA